MQFQNWGDNSFLETEFRVKKLEELKIPSELYLYSSFYYNGSSNELRNFVLEYFHEDIEYQVIGTSSFLYNPEILVQYNVDSEADFHSKDRRYVMFYLYGKKDIVTKFYDFLVTLKNKNKKAVVNWYFTDYQGRLDNFSSEIKNEQKLYPSLYPYIPNVEEYIDSYIASKENILIMLGDPGTGKTSLIRHMLLKNNSTAFTTYDQKVMEEDDLYIQFLKDPDVNYLILEDADLILSHRLDGNKIMSKILNAADGLISFENKKIIFSANITDKGKIDDALVRPGRCFDILEFRPLTHQEALIASEEVGIPLKEKKKEYTVADIFN